MYKIVKYNYGDATATVVDARISYDDAVLVCGTIVKNTPNIRASHNGNEWVLFDKHGTAFAKLFVTEM